MRKLRSMLIGRLLSVLAMSLFIFPIHVTTAFAEEKATTKIRHKSLEYYVPSYRIQVEANVEDTTGVALVRCYFRAAGQADYIFVPMAKTEKGLYKGILPAPASQTPSMEYLFLVVSGQNRVIKSQIFTVDKKELKDAPSWQMAGKEGPLPVSTEISQASDITGYYADNIALNLVDPSLRYGYAAALYDVSKMVLAGNAAGSAASASSGGAVIAEAESGGLSKAWYIGLGVGALAIIGGAAAAGGGGGGSSTPAPTPAPTSAPTPSKSLFGVWRCTTGWYKNDDYHLYSDWTVFVQDYDVGNTARGRSRLDGSNTLVIEVYWGSVFDRHTVTLNDSWTAGYGYDKGGNEWNITKIRNY